jgi:hypothetical protein
MEADLTTMVSSWGVRIWLLLMAGQLLVTVPTSAHEGTAAESLSGLLATFPLIWSTFVIINSSGAVASESGVVADSILSKAVTRYDYILAKMASRLVTVLGLYVAVAATGAYLISRYAIAGHLDRAGVVWGILLVGMMLALLTILAVGFSAIFNRTLVALIVVWVIWYAAGGITALFQVEYLSPLHIVEGLPELLQGDFVWADQWRILIGFALVSGGVALASALHFARKDL